MKPVAEVPEAGSVVTKTTTTRILPVANDKPIQFWDYLAEISPTDWQRHILYMYRTEPSGPGGQSVPLGKFVDTSVIPWHEQEEAELAIMQRFGGRMFRVIVKRGSERICEGKIYIDAAPRMVAPQPQEVVQTTGAGYPMSEANATAQVAGQAISAIAAQEPAGVRLALDAIATTANVIKNFADKPPTQQDETQKQIMAILIQRALAPPPDPMDAITRLLALQNQLTGGPTVNPLDNFLKMAEMLKTFGVNIGQNSTPAVSAGAELVRTLPNIAQYIVSGLTEYRLMMEAQRDAISMQRNPAAAPPVQAQPSLPAPKMPPAPAPLPASQPVNGGVAPGMPDFMSLIESKIIEILSEPQSAEWAAEEAIAFLDRLDKNIIPQLASQGETGLMGLFTTRPILKPAMSNPSRVTEFIRAFLKYAGENAGDGQSAAAKPN